MNLVSQQIREFFLVLDCPHHTVQPHQLLWEEVTIVFSMLAFLQLYGFFIFLPKHGEPLDKNSDYFLSLRSHYCNTFGCQSTFDALLQFISEVKGSAQKHKSKVRFHRSIDPFQNVVEQCGFLHFSDSLALFDRKYELFPRIYNGLIEFVKLHIFEES